MNIEERIQLMMQLKRFFLKYKGLYESYEQDYLLDAVKHGSYPETYYQEGVREILDYYQMIPDQENIYQAFLEEIKNAHGIEEKNIVEIGGGPFVNLSKRMVLQQQKGTVTVYDPRILKSKREGRLVLKKETFTPKTNVKKVDLIVGLMPCKGAEPLVSSAIKNEIDFMVWLCEGGPHGDYFDYFEDALEWRDSMKIVAERGVEEKKMGKLRVKYLPHFSKEYPILYNER